jgi:hypothetical protein
MSPLDPPRPLTEWERRVLWGTSLLVALTRIYAMARSPWDWDEIQFAFGVHDYEVAAHHPHPPGFPVFIGVAKIVRLFAPSDFRALQFVSFVAACSLFPLAFLLARELRFRFATSFMAALLFVFFPTIWFYGGTAFSDISGVAMSLAAAWLLLRGRWSPRSFVAGAIVLGIAIGIRTQTVLVGAVPFLATAAYEVRRRWTRVIAAICIVITIGLACYAGAALASRSAAAYRGQLEGTREWVRKVDSFFSPTRAPLRTLVDEFFLSPQGGRRLPVVIAILAGVALVASPFVAPRAGVGIAVAMFAPTAVFAWLMLDPNSVHRYGTAYIFLWALLAAHGAAVLTMPLRQWSILAQVTLLALIAGRAAYWTIPALREVRSRNSPPFAAIQWLRSRVPPRGRVWVHPSLLPFATYYLSDRAVMFPADVRRVAMVARNANEYVASEGVLESPVARFEWPRTRLWEIARRRYFEVFVAHASNVWSYGEGWYGHESDGTTIWQWMGRRADARLAPMPRRARLAITVAGEGHIKPALEVWVNGAMLDRFVCTEKPMRHEWIVDARSDRPNELLLVASESANLQKMGIADDPRELSVMLRDPVWEEAR